MKRLLKKICVWTPGLFAGFVPLTGDQFSNNIQLAPFLTQAFQSGSLPDFFNAAFKSAIAIGAILAVLRIAYAGFLYMTTAVWSSKDNAKTILQETLLGLLLLLAVYLILNQINPGILNLDILQHLSPAGSNSAPSTIPGGAPINTTFGSS